MAAMICGRSPRGSGGDMGERVHAADDLSEPFHPGADRLHRRAVDLPVAGKAVVGAHFHHDDARRRQFFVCRPDWIVQRHRDRMGLDAGNMDPEFRERRPRFVIDDNLIRVTWALSLPCVG